MLWLNAVLEKKSDYHFQKDKLEIKILITGVGMVFTAYALGKVLNNETFNLVINAGVAGAYDTNLQLGDVVNVTTEKFGDIGTEENNGDFADIYDLELAIPDQPPFSGKTLVNESAEKFDFLQKVSGITVNTTSGTEETIERIKNKYAPQVETMEGAAVFYACLMENVPFLEIRGISNYVEPRNKENWELTKAIANLNKVLIDMMELFG